MKPKSHVILAGLAPLILACHSALAANATWTGLTDATWATAGNWSTSPVPSTGDTAIFNAASINPIVDLGAGVTVKSVIFDTAAAAAYTIGAGGPGAQTLNLDSAGSIMRNSTVTAIGTIDANLSLGTTAGADSFSITNAGATGSLVLTGGLGSAQTGVKTVTVGGAGAITLSGIVADGSGILALNKTLAGMLTLSGANTYSGGTMITGIVNAANDTALGSGNVTVVGAAGNQLQLANGVNVGNALVLNGGGVVAQGAVYVPIGSATYSGTISISAAPNAGGIFATGGSGMLTLAGDNTLSTTVPITVRTGVVKLSGAQSYTTGTTLANGGAMIQFGKIASMPATGAVTLSALTSVAVNVGGTGEFTAGAGAGTIGGLLAGIGGQGAAVTTAAGVSIGIDTSNATASVTHTGAFTSIANNLGLVKLGTGTLELTGGGTYAGGGAPGFPLVARQGTLLLNGGTHAVTGELVVGGIFGTGNGGAGLDATLQIDSGALTVSTWLSVGRGNGMGGVSSDLVLNNNATVTTGNFSAGMNGGNAANLPKGTITLNGTSTLSVAANGAFHLAESAGSNMTLTLNDSSSVTLNGTPGGDNARNIGNLGTGTLNINGTASFTDAATRFLNVGYQNGTGIINLAGGTFNHPNSEIRVGTSSTNGAFTGSGTFNVTGGTATVGALTVGRGNNNQALLNGTVTVSGGTFTSSGDVVLGFAGAGNTGTLNVSGGTFNVGTTAAKWLQVGVWDTAKGILNVSSGNLKLNTSSAIKMNRQAGIGANVINFTGGAVTFYSDNGTTVGGTGNLDLQNVGAAASNNTVNLDGGTLTVPQVISTAVTGTRTFNFNGGTLKAAANSANFFNLGTGAARANVRNIGALIDSNGFAVTIPQALEHSNILDDAEIDGGLIKTGTGTLTLSGANSYTGATTVNAGTLALGGTGSVNQSSGITVNGATAKLLQTSTTDVWPVVTLTQGTVDGTGILTQLNVADSAANSILAGNGGAGTLTVGTLTFNGAATFTARATGTTVDQSLTVGSLSTSGTSPVVINASNTTGVWTSGTNYPLINFNTYGLADTSHFSLATVSGLNPNQSAVLVNTGTAIELKITGESLVWTGAQSADWTTAAIGGAKNWSYLGNGIEFSTNSPVVFSDTATRFGVNLAANLAPSAVVFSNSANDYTLSSTGGFGLTTGTLVLNGTSKVTISTANSSTGVIAINAGTLEISGAGSVAASSTITNNSNLVLNLSGLPQVYANPIVGTGSVTKSGTAALTLSGANTFSGAFTLNNGQLNLNSAGALGAGPGAFVLNGGSLDNTSSAEVIMTGTKPQTWNTDVVFTGTQSLAMGAGTVTLGGAGTFRTVAVAANTLRVGALSGTGFGLVKTGAGTLVINSNAAGTISGPLDIQQGIVGSSEDFFVGGLIGTGIYQNSGLTNTKWSFFDVTSSLTFDGIIRNNDGTNTYQMGIVKRGAGTWTLTNNANNATGNLSVDAGKLILNNTGTYGARNNDGSTVTNLTSVIGNTAGTDAVLEINGANVNYNNRSAAGVEVWRSTLNIGGNATASAAVKLTAGTLTTNMQLGVGVTSGCYGAFTQTGGTTTVGGFLATAFGTAQAVFNVSGGTYTQTAGPVTNGVGAGGLGVMSISGTAIYNQNGTADSGIWLGENGTGVLNVLGNAAVNLAAVNNGLQLGRNATGVGLANLVGGTVTTKAVYKGLGTGTLNFNGGTLKANQANPDFLTGLTETYIYAAGGTIDNGGNAITIGQPLLAPTGAGVSVAGLTTNGGGYIATPLVTVTGDGFGATAVAEIDASGNLTGITMTSPGRDYTYAILTLDKGGSANTGEISGSPAVMPNTSGSLTFSGAAATTLTAVNTYTGNTIVDTGSSLVLADNAGLKFAPGANGATNKLTGGGTAQIAGDFTIDLTNAAVVNGNSWTLVDTATKGFDPGTFTVASTTTPFTETSEGIHQLVDGANTWTFTESSGKLTLAITLPGGYNNWVNGFGLGADDKDPTDDPDRDGFNNLLEYVLGGNPNAGSTSLAPHGVKTGGDYVLTFTRNDLALTGGDVAISLEYGDNLGTWSLPVAVPASSGTVSGINFQVTDGSPNDTIIATIPTAGATKFFARVKAVK